MSSVFPVILQNGQQTFPNGGAKDAQQVTIVANTPPGAGTVTLDYQLIGSTSWTRGDTATNQPLTAPVIINVPPGVANYRLTIAGLTGGAGMYMYAADVDPTGIPPLAFAGLRAINVQTYIESNVKLGQQFYIQSQIPVMEHGTLYNATFKTGALPVLVKDRQVYGNGNAWSYQAFKAPTGVSGGTPITIQNFNDINPGTSLCTLTTGVTATGYGTPWGDAQRVFGSNSATNRVGQGLVPGGDKILKPNSTYLIQFNNFDTTTGAAGEANIDYFLSWYEGQPDLPRP
jgi:hypothetical protein